MAKYDFVPTCELQTRQYDDPWQNHSQWKMWRWSLVEQKYSASWIWTKLTTRSSWMKNLDMWPHFMAPQEDSGTRDWTTVQFPPKTFLIKLWTILFMDCQTSCTSEMILWCMERTQQNMIKHWSHYCRDSRILVSHWVIQNANSEWRRSSFLDWNSLKDVSDLHLVKLKHCKAWVNQRMQVRFDLSWEWPNSQDSLYQTTQKSVLRFASLPENQYSESGSRKRKQHLTNSRHHYP